MKPRVTLSNLLVKEGHCPYTLGNLSIVAYCNSKGNPVTLLSHSQDPAEIARQVIENRPDICGFSVNYATQPIIVEAIHILRDQINPLIVLGGPSITYAPPESKVLRTKADLFVRGDGEIAFNEIIQVFPIKEDLIEGKIKIQGVSSRRFHNPELALLDLTQLVSPYPVNFESDHFYWETVRGCVFGCIYCAHSGKKGFFREIPKKRLEKELEFFESLPDLRAIYITDPVLGGRKERTKEILKLISRLKGIFITASLRPEYLDDETISLLQEVQIGWLDIGIQTTNQDLSYFRRNSPKSFERLPKLHDVGISYNLDLIVGIPGDTSKSVTESMRYVIEEAKPTTFKAFRLRVYEGTVLHQMALQHRWDFGEESRYMQSNQSFSRDELNELMDFANTTTELYSFLVANNWFNEETKLRRLELFKRFHIWKKDKKGNIPTLWGDFNEKEI